MKIFKARCSSLNDLNAGTYGLSEAQAKTIDELSVREGAKHKPLTEKQRETFLQLEASTDRTPAKQKQYEELEVRKDALHLPLSPKQIEELSFLRDRFDNPELPSSPKTVGIKWLNNILYETVGSASSKYTSKGNTVESETLDLMAEYYKLPFLFQDQNHLEDENFTGSRDAFQNRIVFDAKSSWSHDTFPLWTKVLDPKYYGQMQGYMHLSKCEKAVVGFGLIDTPDFIVKSESYRISNETGEKWSEELYLKVKASHTYSHLPLKLRLKIFEVSYDKSFMDESIVRVGMVRKFLDNLLKTEPEVFDIFVERCKFLEQHNISTGLLGIDKAVD